jgi:hypothetical protein
MIAKDFSNASSIRLQSQRLHLANCDRVQAPEAIALWNFHMNELGVHAFDVCED